MTTRAPATQAITDSVVEMEIVVARSADADMVSAVSGLLNASRHPDGSRPLSDRMWVELRHADIHDYTGFLIATPDHTVPLGYAQLSRGPDEHLLEVVLHPQLAEPDDAGAELLDAALSEVADHGGGRVVWWVSEPRPPHHRLAEQAGFTVGRMLHQMQADLPITVSGDLITRPFRPGVDDEAWLAVNNRAFAGHGEQGEWDLAQLRARCAEDWFDADGFLIHEVERDGRHEILGFCWTKVHTDTTPQLGEIYVIAADPSAQGTGLGRRLTVAGLQHLHQRGLHRAMLYVDSHNTPALGLYRSLGFEITRTDLAFSLDLPAQ